MKALPSLAACLLLMASCKESTPAAKPAPAADPAVSEKLASLFTTTQPESALSVTAARQDPVPDKEITVSGRIMGAVEVFVANRAVFTLADPDKLTACSDRPGDSCKTPWDNCCEDQDLIRASVVSVQVVDETGKVLPAGLKGVGGLTELSRVIVKGTVAEGSGKDLLVVNASSIYVQP